MITAERLEELIKQSATIWNDYIGEYKLNKNQCKICKVTDMEFNFIGYCLWCEYEHHGEIHTTEIKLEDLEENVERGKWHYKTTAERTERFEPPMWEDIEVIYTFKFINDNECMSLIANKKYNFVAISNGLTVLFEEKYTKENYEKACEIVRDLFNKGGAK
ncbi:MAG: hypothetical protein IKT33_03565 [Clostridia bacterium]|nr:hypothetical protein [Clostridia bacterium]